MPQTCFFSQCCSSANYGIGGKRGRTIQHRQGAPRELDTDAERLLRPTDEGLSGGVTVSDASTVTGTFSGRSEKRYPAPDLDDHPPTGGRIRRRAVIVSMASRGEMRIAVEAGSRFASWCGAKM